MIDWVKCKLPILHEPIRSGAFVVINPDGEIERESPMSSMVEGSYSQNISVRSVGSNGGGKAEYLEICGNPAKFLQGHNVFGSNDLLGLVHGAAQRIIINLGLDITDFEMNLIETGNYYINWIDINESFELRNQVDVQAWIKAAEFSSRTRCGRPTLKGSTLYHQKHSRRFGIKFYSKNLELRAGKKHELPYELRDTGIFEWTENILRAEVRLLGKELRSLKIEKAYQLTEKRIEALYGEYMKKIILTEQLRLSDETSLKLPGKLRSTYTLWSEGHSIIDMLSKATFYRHRKELLEFDIDISIACKKKESNVVPLIRVLEAMPAQIPTWAIENGLIYKSEIRKAS
ncbi:MAG: Replication-associated protein G2P [Pseudohongiella sp.]|nr:Replication-associated protein G2P [Pseudohongiella sp.]